MLIEAGKPFAVAASDAAVVRFTETPTAAGPWTGGRSIRLGEEVAFELSHGCGTCQLLFRRVEGADRTLSISEMAQRLAVGIDRIDGDVVGRFAALLSEDTYVPMLVSVSPRLIQPGRPGDYFSEEQVATWDITGFWGLPEYPQTPYYRTWQTAVNSDAHLFEFVVPMVPPTWNNQDTVAKYAALLAESSAPTAVAVSILDVCQPAVNNGTDYFVHWGLTHFLLDGHHKLEAAARTGRSLRLLSLLALDASLATEKQVAQLRKLRSRPAANRAGF